MLRAGCLWACAGMGLTLSSCAQEIVYITLTITRQIKTSRGTSIPSVMGITSKMELFCLWKRLTIGKPRVTSLCWNDRF